MVLDMDAIYTVLVEECAAPDGEWDRPAFIASYEDDSWPTEYRFCGALGFGGKFWVNDGHLYVTCYREDATPERLAMIARANLRLAKFIAELPAPPDWDDQSVQFVGDPDPKVEPEPDPEIPPPPCPHDPPCGETFAEADQ